MESYTEFLLKQIWLRKVHLCILADLQCYMPHAKFYEFSLSKPNCWRITLHVVYTVVLRPWTNFSKRLPNQIWNPTTGRRHTCGQNSRSTDLDPLLVGEIMWTHEAHVLAEAWHGADRSHQATQEGQHGPQVDSYQGRVNTWQLHFCHPSFKEIWGER